MAKFIDVAKGCLLKMVPTTISSLISCKSTNIELTIFKIIDINITKKFTLTIEGFCIKKVLKTSKSWLCSEVFKNVLQAEYRLPGYKIIIKGVLNKFIFSKKEV